MSCPVCFGGEDTVVRESLNAGIGVLLGVTGVVLGLFACFFLKLARGSRDAAHLVGGRDLAFEDTLIPGSPLQRSVLDK